LRLLGRLDHDLQHAILEGRCCFLRDTFRQRNGALERAIGSLGAVEAFPVFLLPVLALAGDVDRIIRDLYLYVILAQPWKIRPDHQVVPSLKHFDVRDPKGLAQPHSTALHRSPWAKRREKASHPEILEEL